MTEKEKKLLSSLGICAKAGKVIFGVPLICEAMRKDGAKRPLIVVEASDTSENTHKRITDKCAYYNVKHCRISVDSEALAAALGKISVVAAVAVTDEQLTILVEKNL